MPLADLVAPTIGGGQCKGSYMNLVEQFEGTPDGYLHVASPPGGEAYDVLLVSDSSFALVKGHDTGTRPSTLPQSYAMRPVVFANFLASCFGAKVASKSSRGSMRALMNWRSCAVNEICHCALC